MSTPAQDLFELLYLRERGWPVDFTIWRYAMNLIAAGCDDERGGC